MALIIIFPVSMLCVFLTWGGYWGIYFLNLRRNARRPSFRRCSIPVMLGELNWELAISTFQIQRQILSNLNKVLEWWQAKWLGDLGHICSENLHKSPPSCKAQKKKWVLKQWVKTLGHKVCNPTSLSPIETYDGHSQSRYQCHFLQQLQRKKECRRIYRIHEELGVWWLVKMFELLGHINSYAHQLIMSHTFKPLS